MNKVPTDFRRATLMATRLEPALTIYRDILGMAVFYDEEIEVSVPGRAADAPKVPARLVILKCNDPYIGMLGLLHLLEEQFDEVRPGNANGQIRAGEAMLVMQHENVEAAFEQIREVEGVRIVDEPRISEFHRGDSVLRVEGFRFFDPNGYFIDLNQFVE